ncbi:MAG: formylglycine-generating enzyme family protein, partial [Planctomycetota bacterium]
YEVTRAQWTAAMGSSPSLLKEGAEDTPVEGVSWSTCKAFCTALSLHLPTEAQWEHACRAGTKTATYAGNLASADEWTAPVLDEIAWWGGNAGPRSSRAVVGGPKAVGRKRPNAYGLYDMLGNVSEWCEDVYVAVSFGGESAGAEDPLNGSDSAYRVIRGGGWKSFSFRCRAATRVRNLPEHRSNALGFRPVLNLP